MTVPSPEVDAQTPILEMRGIVKRFDAALALDGVDFSLRPGEIHALLGENGAGKSTLMNILRGLTAPTAGQILLNGQPVTFGSPQHAAHARIGMVHQHFLLVPPFTVPENLALASASAISFVLDTGPIIARARETGRRLGWPLPPLNTATSDLPVGTQQRVEILKALMGDARILLFDEPTAVLAPQEIGDLLRVLRTLRDEGRSLVFVSHKLSEVMALCDRVTVLRRGRNAGTVAVSETSPSDLARRMVGESTSADSEVTGENRVAQENRATPTDAVRRRGDPPGRPGKEVSPALAVEGLTTAPDRQDVILHHLSFALQPGEILGFAGVDGNGQAELAQALTGQRPWVGGTVRVGGEAIVRFRPQDMARYGIALIPPDRRCEGLALTLSVAENLTLEAVRLPEFRRGPFLDRRALRRFAEQTARDFDVRTDSLDTPAGALSGGNQQKIVIARALWRKPRLLVAVSPTRGLDVAATAYVHGRLRKRQSEGGAIILISTELDEVIALSSRIAVLYEGRIVGIVPPDTPRGTLGLMMGGRSGADETEASAYA